MRMLWVLMVFCLLGNGLWGQGQEKPKFRIEALFNAGNMFMIKDTDYSNFHVTIPPNIKLKNKYKLQPNIGLGVNFWFKDRIALYLGVGFWQMNQLKEFSEAFEFSDNGKIKKFQVVLTRFDLNPGINIEFLKFKKQHFGLLNNISLSLISQNSKKYYQNLFIVNGETDYFWYIVYNNQIYFNFDNFFLKSSFWWNYDLNDKIKIGLNLGAFYNFRHLFWGYYTILLNTGFQFSYSL